MFCMHKALQTHGYQVTMQKNSRLFLLGFPQEGVSDQKGLIPCDC